VTLPLDVLAIMAHPDDAELLCGGALLKSAALGRRVGVLDLTAGEMGSAGSVELRAREATAAAAIMGLAERRCAGLPDSALENDNESRHVVAEHLRRLRPRVVITHWRVGRHRDHRIASELVRDACFLSGLKKLDIEGSPFGRSSSCTQRPSGRTPARQISSSTSRPRSTRSWTPSPLTLHSSRGLRRPGRSSREATGRWSTRFVISSLTTDR